MKVQRWTRVALTVLGAALLAAVVVGTAQGTPKSDWGTPVNLGGPVDDTSNFEGCPAESPNGKSLYFAQPGTGPLDIWVSHRANKNAPWGTPEDLPAPVNTDAYEFCPTPVPGNGLFFVSSRGPSSTGPGYCGSEPNSDIYFTRYNPAHGGSWSTPVHLPCAADGGPNMDGWEQGPSYFHAGGHGYLYFSDGSDPGSGHIYASEQQPDGSFGPATPVAELNSSTDDSTADLRPNVSADGREVVFESTRDGGLGGRDIWTATRQTPHSAWTNVHDITAVNTKCDTHRATLSRDGKRLYFGSNRADTAGNTCRGSGSSELADIWVSTRK